MSECLDCKSTCFSTTDDCWQYTGPSNDSLGIEQNQSGKTVVTKIVEELSSLKGKVDSCNSCGDGVINDSDSIQSDVDLNLDTPLRCGQTSASQSTGRSLAPANVITTPTKTGFTIDYNIENLVPQGATILNSKASLSGMKNGYPANLAESRDCRGSFRLSPDNFDANLNLDLRYATEEGEFDYKGSIPLSACESNDNYYLSGGNTTRRTSNTQSDANKIFDDCIVNLQSQINSLTANDIWGEFLSLRNRVIELESLLEDISNLNVQYIDSCDECDTGNITRTLGEALSKSSSCCCENKDNIQTITNTVTQQQTQIRNIPSIINNTTTTTTTTTTGGPSTPSEGDTVYVCETRVVRTGNCITGVCEEEVTGCFQQSLDSVSGDYFETKEACEKSCGEGSACSDVSSRISSSFIFNEGTQTYTISWTNNSSVSVNNPPSGTYTYTPGSNVSYTFIFADGCEYTTGDNSPNDPGDTTTDPPDDEGCDLTSADCLPTQVFNAEACRCDEPSNPCSNVSCSGCQECDATGTCVDSDSNCPDGQTCNNGVCEQPATETRLACCFNGECFDNLTQQECNNLGAGASWGPEFLCTPNLCS